MELYSKCPYSNIRSQQRIQISVDAVIKDKIFQTQNIVHIIEIFQLKKKTYRKKIIQKKKMKTTPQIFCVAEDWMLLDGGVLYGFTHHSRSECKLSTYEPFFIYVFRNPSWTTEMLDCSQSL